MCQEGTLEETWGRGSNVCNSEERKSSSVQSLSRVRLFVTPRTAAHQASLSITNSQSLLKLMSIKSVMPSNRLILCHPLLLPPIFPSIRVFSNESVLHIRWPKNWSFSFSISPSKTETNWSCCFSKSLSNQGSSHPFPVRLCLRQLQWQQLQKCLLSTYYSPGPQLSTSHSSFPLILMKIL